MVVYLLLCVVGKESGDGAWGAGVGWCVVRQAAYAGRDGSDPPAPTDYLAHTP